LDPATVFLIAELHALIPSHLALRHDIKLQVNYLNYSMYLD